MKLIKLNTDHYVVVDDSEIGVGDWCEDNGTIYNIKDKNHLLTVLNFGSPVKITHSTEPIEDYTRVDGITIKVYVQVKSIYLYEVKELLGEVDVEKKVRNEMGIPDYLPTNSMSPSMQGSLEFGIKCYNQALEDNKEKKYTEEDLKRYHNIMCLHGNKKGEEFIQSLQPKTEWDVEFIDGKLTLKKL